MRFSRPLLNGHDGVKRVSLANTHIPSRFTCFSLDVLLPPSQRGLLFLRFFRGISLSLHVRLLKRLIFNSVGELLLAARPRPPRDEYGRVLVGVARNKN